MIVDQVGWTLAGSGFPNSFPVAACSPCKSKKRKRQHDLPNLLQYVSVIVSWISLSLIIITINVSKSYLFGPVFFTYHRFVSQPDNIMKKIKIGRFLKIKSYFFRIKIHCSSKCANDFFKRNGSFLAS